MADVVTRTVCLLGFGTVGRRFCELVARKGDELAADHGLRVLFAAVGTGSHGSLIADPGLTAAEVLAAFADGPGDPVGARAARGVPQPQASGTGSKAGAAVPPVVGFPGPERSGVELIAASGADLLVEATPLDPHGGVAAIAHLEAGLTRGMDAITVNKGPIAWDYRRLADLAASRDRRLLFEGAVMDGLPVFSLFRSCLPGCRLLGFEAVLNSTTNSILDAMGEGVSFADALAQVQAEGYAEADPSHDIDGHDAAAKTAARTGVPSSSDTASAPASVRATEHTTRSLLPAARTAATWSAVTSRMPSLGTSSGVRSAAMSTFARAAVLAAASWPSMSCAGSVSA